MAESESLGSRLRAFYERHRFHWEPIPVLPPEEQPPLGPMLREFFPLMIMVAFQQLLALTVNLVDNLMLGAYSETSMAAASVINQVFYMFLMVAVYTGAALMVLAAQFWGKRDIDPIKRYIVLALRTVLIFGAAFCIVLILVPEWVMGLFTNDPVIIAEGAIYARIVSWTFVVFGVSRIFMNAMQGVQTAFIGVVMTIVVIIVNVFFNYVLIYGNLGAPEMGIKGAAIATLLARIFELVLIASYMLFFDRKLKMKFREFFILDKSFVESYRKVTIPLLIAGILWGVSQAVQTSILGHMSTEALAANAVSSVIWEIFTITSAGCASAASVIVGKTIGEGHMGYLRKYARALQVVFVIFGALGGLLLFLTKDFFLGFYNVSPETYELTIAMICILSVTTVGTCIEYPDEGGIVAGGGDTGYQVVVDNICMWLWTIPSSLIAAFVFHASPVIVFMFLKSDQLIKVIPNTIKVNRFHWARNLTLEASEIDGAEESTVAEGGENVKVPNSQVEETA